MPRRRNGTIEWWEDGVHVFYESSSGLKLKVSWQNLAELASAAETFTGGSHSWTYRFASGDWAPDTFMSAYRDLQDDAKEFSALLSKREKSAEGATSAAEYRSIRNELDADWEALEQLQSALDQSAEVFTMVSSFVNENEYD